MCAYRGVPPSDFLTIDEFERLPESEDRTELVRGMLVREPPAGGEHGWLAGEVLGRVRNFVRQHRLGVTLAAETGFVLSREPPTVRAPDAAFVARDRLPPEGIPTGFWPGAPDLAVEVVSPSNTMPQIQDKVLDYLEAGTRAVWIVEPRRRTVVVYHSRQDIRILTETDVLEGGDVLPGFQVPVAELFET